MSQYHSERSTRYGRRGAIARQVRHMLMQREGGNFCLMLVVTTGAHAVRTRRREKVE